MYYDAEAFYDGFVLILIGLVLFRFAVAFYEWTQNAEQTCNNETVQIHRDETGRFCNPKTVCPYCGVNEKLLKGRCQGCNVPKVYLPKPGCGAGGLKWADVAPLCARYSGGGESWLIVCDLK